MKQTFLGVLVVAGVASVAAAQSNQQQNGSDFTALTKPDSPFSKTPSAIRVDPRVYDTDPPPRFNLWRSIQDPLDRSLGRIEDQQSYEVGRIERSREERSYDAFRRREFEQFEEDRERELRLEDRARRSEQDEARARRRELDRREYLVYLNGGYGPLASQVEADRVAMEQARAGRDRELFEAAAALESALKQPRANREQLQEQYEQTRQQIRARYEAERARILGLE